MEDENTIFNDHIITSEKLYYHGFVRHEMLGNLLLSIITDDKYKIDMKLITDENPGNSINFWFCQVYNDTFKSIGNCELSTIKQFNLFMEVIGTKFRLTK